MYVYICKSREVPIERDHFVCHPTGRVALLFFLFHISLSRWKCSFITVTSIRNARRNARCGVAQCHHLFCHDLIIKRAYWENWNVALVKKSKLAFYVGQTKRW